MTNTTFADKMKRHLQHRREKETRKDYGYLNLPKNVKTLKFDEDVRKVKLDFMLYRVTDKRHPDCDPPDIAMEGMGWYSRPFSVHRNVGADDESAVCLTSIGKKCPICEYRVKRIKEGADKEEFKEFYPKQRRLYVVIPIAVKKKDSEKWEEFGDGQPVIWDMSTKLFQELLDETLEEDPDNFCFPNLEDGKTAILTIKWEKLGKNSYPEVRHIEFDDREPYDESALDEMPNLDNLLIVPTYEELHSKFFETDVEEDGGILTAPKRDEEEEEEKPRRSFHKPDKDEEEAPKRSSFRKTTSTDVSSGRKPVKEEDDPEPESEPEKKSFRKPKEFKKEETPPVKKSFERRKLVKEENVTSVEKPKSSKERCEYGHRFGIDAMDFDECETECSIWSECAKQKERNK